MTLHQISAMVGNPPGGWHQPGLMTQPHENAGLVMARCASFNSDQV